APGVGSPADRVDSRPVKIGAGRRRVAVYPGIDIEVLGVRIDLPQAVILTRLAESAKRHLIGPLGTCGVILPELPPGPDLLQQPIDAVVRQPVRGDSARRTRSDNYCIVDFLLHLLASLPTRVYCGPGPYPSVSSRASACCARDIWSRIASRASSGSR